MKLYMACKPLKLTEDLMLNLQRILASFEWDEDDYATVHAFTDGPHYPLLEALVEKALSNTRVPDPSALHAARLEAAEAALEAGKRAGALWALDMKAEALRIVAALEKKKEEV
jgi:hypothetical protein